MVMDSGRRSTWLRKLLASTAPPSFIQVGASLVKLALAISFAVEEPFRDGQMNSSVSLTVLIELCLRFVEVCSYSDRSCIGGRCDEVCSDNEALHISGIDYMFGSEPNFY
jgi:hypothetical protein